MKYTIEFAKQAAKQFKALTRQEKQRLKTKITFCLDNTKIGFTTKTCL